MDAQWHLIQYTADLRRKEPRNIGVVTEVGDSWAIRMFAVDEDVESEDGVSINGRKLRKLHVPKEGYQSWVEYFRRLALDGRVEDILRHQRRRPSEFGLVRGGFVATHQSASDLAARLYNELVDDPSIVSEPRLKVLHTKVEQTLSIAEIVPLPDVEVAASWGKERKADDHVRFDYSYENGVVHLMDRLQLHQTSIGTSQMVARDFNARVTAARAAGSSGNFVAFFSGEAVDEMGTDVMLTPVFKVARTVDVDDVERAADTLRQIMHA